MATDRSVIAGSERISPAGLSLGPAPGEDVTDVSVYLKLEPSSPGRPADGAFRTRADLAREREPALHAAVAAVTTFAASCGLKVIDVHPGRRLVRLQGSVTAFETAFGAQLHRYSHEGREFRGRTGSLSAPSDLAPMIEAVLGLDQRPVATPKSIRLARAKANTGFLPNAVARLYDLPNPAQPGQGECIAILELGGGFNAADTDQAFAAMGLSSPSVVAVAVSGGSNHPGKDTDADGEVALDIQGAGGVAPGARLAVYFAANTDQGFVDAISQAAHDQANAPSVVSISWGSPEDAWTAQAVAAMTSALQDAADLGLTVTAASGDGLATDGASDGKAHVDFPASSPLVLGCGGVKLDASGGAITGETVWNSDGGGTGGGISDLFPVPAYQTGIKLPADANGPRQGRGVPDVAGDADPNTGYRVIVDGQSEVIGGTSAAAPLWAGLFALINQAAGRPSGQPHAVLYSRPEAFNDITSGNNRSGGLGYKAAKGWDACTGLGTPKGAALTAVFSGKAEGAPSAASS